MFVDGSTPNFTTEDRIAHQLIQDLQPQPTRRGRWNVNLPRGDVRETTGAAASSHDAGGIKQETSAMDIEDVATPMDIEDVANAMDIEDVANEASIEVQLEQRQILDSVWEAAGTAIKRNAEAAGIQPGPPEVEEIRPDAMQQLAQATVDGEFG